MGYMCVQKSENFALKLEKAIEEIIILKKISSHHKMEGNTVQQPLSKYLIIDTAGFIKNPPLQEFGQNLITLREVIDEIRDKETKQRLKALPYEMQFLEPDSEAIKIVSDFSRKTGDFASLSATDIKVLALTYMLEVRHVGIDHLLSEPKISKTV